jgi:hypothetical protein
MDLEEYSAEDRLADLEKEREELREQVFKDAQLDKLDNPEGPTVVNSPAEEPATAEKTEEPKEKSATADGPTFDEAFPGSTDTESFNYRDTNPDGTTRLRPKAGPNREEEIIGPTREPGRYEPGGYQPGTIMDPEVESPLRGVAEATQGISAGLGDWFTSEINKLQWAGVQVPRPANVNSELQDAMRDVTAVLAPTLSYFFGAKAGLKNIHARGIAPKKLQALGNDPAFKMLSDFGLSQGVGAYVDSTSYQSLEDHNIAGMLKKNWPKFWQNKLPNWLATSDAEGADSFRHKNRLESGALGTITEAIGGLARLTKAVVKTEAFSMKWLPRSERSSMLNRLAGRNKETAQETTLRTLADAADAKNKALDDLGAYYLSKVDADAPITKPIKGVHRLWDMADEAMRTVDDGGIPGAMTDMARVARSAGTQNGRLRSAVSSVTLKYGLEPENMARGFLLDEATKQLAETDGWDVVIANYGKLSYEDITKTATSVAETLLEPGAEPGFLVKILDKFSQVTEEGVKRLDPIGQSALKKAITGYQNKMYTLARHIAGATLDTSLAGQVSDTAETVLENLSADSAKHLLEEMFDRFEVLMVHQRMNQWAGKNTMLNPDRMDSFKTLMKNNPEEMKRALKTEEVAQVQALQNTMAEAKDMVGKFREIAEENPAYLKPFLEQSDYANGNVANLRNLYAEYKELMGTWHKAFYDGKPEIPSMVVQAGWSNVMNSKLSAFSTPLSAKIGNTGGLLQKWQGMYSGALMSGDMYSLRRAHHAYGAMSETFGLAQKAYNETLYKLTTQPTKAFQEMRPDVALKIDERMSFVESMAEAAMEEGNDGPMILVQQLKAMQDFALHPVMRFNSNVMSADDAWAQAYLANIQARFDAFDAVHGKIQLKDFVKEGLNKKEMFDEAYKIAHAKIFDENGRVVDKRVIFDTKEVAMQLDNSVSKGFSWLTRRLPILRSVFTFPRNNGNALSLFAKKYNPISPMVAGFGDDLYNYAFKPYSKYKDVEIFEALSKKGITDLPIEQARQKFISLRHEAKGRLAAAGFFTMGAYNAFINDRITGDGHWDPKVQRAREKNGNWKSRTYTFPTGHQISYAGLGPIADLVATAVNALDNYETLGEEGIETIGQKISFFLGANLKEKVMMDSLKTTLDMFSGNEGAINRWTAGMMNDFIPGAGQRTEWGRLMTPERRELNRTMDGYFRNKNKFADTFVPEEQRLPISYDWLHGDKVDGTESFLIRLNNTYNRGFTISEKESPEHRFLTAVEYNAEPAFSTDPGTGIEYTNTERSELKRLVGQEKNFLKAVRRIMDKHVDSLDKLEDYRKQGYNNTQLPVDKFLFIHIELDEELNRAVKDARDRLSTRDRLQTEAWIRDANIRRSAKGEPPLTFEAQQFLRDSVNK